MNNDYKDRKYLSAVEVAKFLNIPVKDVHNYAKSKRLKSYKSASGQYRFSLTDVESFKKNTNLKTKTKQLITDKIVSININNTIQTVINKSSTSMNEIEDNNINLIITSPPYFDAKMYSPDNKQDLGNIHDLEEWFDRITDVWKECYRVLQPGRKMFLNIMNLPVRTDSGFKSLNIVGKTIDIFENLGFIFKREIIWHKTNSVRSHFGTYPYPGGILINFSHEFILEFEKPAPRNYRKYAHVTKEQKEMSKLDKDFWIDLKKSDVWLMNPEKSGDNRTHIAPFPYVLPYKLIKAYTFIGEKVLDPFMGSATTLVAARDLERNGIGYEISSEIITEAIKRLKTFQKNLFL